MLDLWSIGLLQIIGGLGAIVTLMAVRRGHYAALLVGLMAGMCMTTATIWFLAIAPSTIVRRRRPAVLALDGTRRLRLNRWLLWDALLVVAGAALVTVLLG